MAKKAVLQHQRPPRKAAVLRVTARLAGLALFGLLAGSQLIHPQAPVNQPEISSHDAPATFSTRVNLVTVPVVVRDSEGRAIGTLRQEDFQLFDKGKPQVISKFSIEKPGEIAGLSTQSPHEGNAQEPAGDTATTIPTRFVAYVFDDLHLEPADLVQARNAAAKHLEEMAPADRAAIFTTSGLNTLDFTDDQAKLRDTLLQIQSRRRAMKPCAECPDVDDYMAELILNENDQQALKVAESNAIVCVPIVVTNGPDGGGMEQAMRQAESFARAAASRALRQAENDTKVALSVLKDVIRRISATPGQRSIVLVSPGFLVTKDYHMDETELMDRAVRANVTVSTLNARGLVSQTAFHLDQAGFDCPDSPEKDQIKDSGEIARSETLGELADGTGGSYFHNNNDLALGLHRLDAQPEFIYLLGFAPQNLKLDGKFHALKVSLKNSKGLTLQARRGYYAPNHAVDASEQAQDEIREAVFSRQEMRDIPLDVETQFFKSSDVSARLTVVSKLDIRRLPFRKANDRNNDTLMLVSGVFDRNGNLIHAVQKRIDMRLKDDTLAKRLGSGIALKTNFDVTPGSYVVRVVVRDQQGQLMAARNSVIEIP
jgi:VWFA-related protein